MYPIDTEKELFTPQHNQQTYIKNHTQLPIAPKSPSKIVPCNDTVKTYHTIVNHFKMYQHF